MATEWLPSPLSCLVVGESPGENAAKYFYNERRPKVGVRTIMLRELHRHSIIDAPSLPAFRSAGFLFDHAVRCLLPSDVIRREVNLASRYESLRARTAQHLEPLLRKGTLVWVMGRIARNAAAAFCCEFPKDRSDVSKLPYPRRLVEAPRFFVSRYLLHASGREVGQIFARLHRFLDEPAAQQCDACQDNRGKYGD